MRLLAGRTVKCGTVIVNTLYVIVALSLIAQHHHHFVH